jgi:hypothetical protein
MKDSAMVVATTTLAVVPPGLLTSGDIQRVHFQFTSGAVSILR